jgi:hypothetical protein
VGLALKFGEFYAEADGGVAATEAMDVAERRIGSLEAGGMPPWCTQSSGLVVRGYVSPIDGSPQPYGMELPDNVVGATVPLFCWLHGRGDQNTDIHFLRGCAERSQFPTERFGGAPPLGVAVSSAAVGQPACHRQKGFGRDREQGACSIGGRLIHWA